MKALVPWDPPTLKGVAATYYIEQQQKHPVRTWAATVAMVTPLAWGPLALLTTQTILPEIQRRFKTQHDAWLQELPSHQEVQVASRQELLSLLEAMRDGAVHPRRLSITVVGPFSQVVSKAYNALYKARAVRRRSQMHAIGSTISAIGALKKDYGASMVGLVFKEHGDALYLDDVVRAALCLPCADLVCTFMLAGLQQPPGNDGETVRIVDGEPIVSVRP